MTKEDQIAGEVFRRLGCLVIGSRVVMSVGDRLSRAILAEPLETPLIVTGVASQSDFIRQYIEVKKLYPDNGTRFNIAVSFPYFYFVEAMD